MFRCLFTVAAVVSLVLCVATIALWVRRVRRGEGWYFQPSPSFAIQSPDPDLPSTWYVQWHVEWGYVGYLSIDRQVTPESLLPQPAGLYSVEVGSERWNPLPIPLAPDKSNVAPTLHTHGKRKEIQRVKPGTSLRFLGVEYIAHQQEFGHFVFDDAKDLLRMGDFYSEGENRLKVPVIYLFFVFAILPTISFSKFCRYWHERRREKQGRCRTCGYDLRASKDRCSECGTASN